MADNTRGVEQALAAFTYNMNAIPFNLHAGFRLLSADASSAVLEFALKPELIGNVHQQSLHGGVIAAAMDFAGGACGIVAAYAQVSPEERSARLQRFGTIDLQVEYLRPGRGKLFHTSATVLRAGNKLCVTRMQLHNDAEQLIATATATYLF